MIRTIDSKNPLRITRTFDSYSEYLALAENVAIENGAARSIDSNGGEKWYGTPNFAAAMTLAREGWQDGLALIDRLTAQVESQSGSLTRKPEIIWDVCGDFADAGLYASGVPECMGAFEETIAEGSGKILRITINGFYSAGFDAETIMKRGAATLALIDALENAGRSCELMFALAMGGSGERGTMHVEMVPLKKAGEHAEMDRLAFICAHPSAFRRIGFSVGENETESVRATFGCSGPGGFYGSPCDYKDAAADITIPEASFFTSQTEQGLLAWIKEQLAAQGCMLETA